MKPSASFLIQLAAGLFILCVQLVSSSNKLSKGFNDNINWVTFQDGINQAEEQRKPIMLLIHKSWCGACKALKPVFAANKQIEELSTKFVMINTEDDEEPQGKKYNPDGGYIPRILFLNSEGELMSDIINANGNANYKYYYPDPAHIYQSMQKVLQKRSSEDDADDKKVEL